MAQDDHDCDQQWQRLAACGCVDPASAGCPGAEIRLEGGSSQLQRLKALTADS